MLLGPILSLLVVSQAASSQVPVTTSSDCRPIGEVMHCFNPPSPRPADPASMDRVQDEMMAEDRRVMAPLAAGPNPVACEAARQHAVTEGRQDLELAIRYICNPDLLERENGQ